MNRKLQTLGKKGMLLALSVGFLNIALCAGNENFREFRESAGPGLESGVQALLDGDETGVDTLIDSIVQGLFDIFEPDSTTGN